MDANLDTLTHDLAATADACDRSGDWPDAALEAFGRCGGWRWAIPQEYGGEGLAAYEQLKVYMAMARGSVSAALIITQRDAAIDLIINGDSDILRLQTLQRYASGQAYTTVGIAQLTTSQQGGPAAITAKLDGDELVLDGLIPWSTGADHAEAIVVGGVTDDGKQILALVPSDTTGVIVDPPVSLVGLQASHTSQVQCKQVRVDQRNIVRGPIEGTLLRRSPVKHWVTSSVGLGLAESMLDQIDKRRAITPPKLVAACDRLDRRVRSIRTLLLDQARACDAVTKADVDDIRVQVNDTLVRLAGVMMTVVKGSGYMASHTAQRLAREAMFFCVWSAPDAIRAQTAELLTRGL